MFPFSTNYIILILRYFLGCALIQIPDFVLSLYGYLCGNIRSERENGKSSKKEVKRNPKYRPELVHNVDPKFRSCNDEFKCNDKCTAIRNQISPMENSCATRLDRIEKIIYDHFERISTVKENQEFKCGSK